MVLEGRVTPGSDGVGGLVRAESALGSGPPLEQAAALDNVPSRAGGCP